MAKSKGTGFGKIFKVLKDDPEIRVGFSNLNLWADTGVYALNHKLSGDYKKAFLYGSLVNVYGESQSGKSLLLASTCAIEQRERNAYVLWVDVEGAESDETEALKWFGQAGVDTHEDRFQRIWLPTYRKALKTMTQFVNHYRDDEGKGELQPLIVVFDSYSQLQTDTMVEQNEGKKDLTGDQGQSAKQLADLVKRMKGMIEGLPILVFGIMHVYMGKEQYGPRHEMTGGMKPMFIAHNTLLMTKYNLTNEKASPHLRMPGTTADDKRVVIGLRSHIEIKKRRVVTLTHKPQPDLDLEVVYPIGIDKYSGLWDMFIEKDMITSPSNGWYEFKRPNGDVKKFQRRDFLKYVDELMAMPVPNWRPSASDTDEPIMNDDEIIAEIDANE
jgi:hypothetical protein